MKEIFDKLLDKYGPQGWWPVKGEYSSGPKTDDERFEVMVGAILTQNTSWSNVEKALNNLNEISIEKIKEISLDDLKEKVKPAGYFNQKAERLKYLVNFLRLISMEQLKKLDAKELRETLLKINGVGPETADSIVLYAFNKPSFVVDTYTKRIFSRLGYLKEEASYDEWQELFHSKLNKDEKMFNEFHALIVEHAKKFCKKKPECDNCMFDC